jgi:hypothetical protein
MLLGSTTQEDLYFSVVLVHSGTVSPKYPIPSMDWKDWDEKGPNELTAMGMREQYLLGYELYRRYEGILNRNYSLDQVYVRMVDHNCTIMSGQAFLRGFLRENKAVLKDDQLKKADPPVAIDSYFKDQIGNLVLPSGVETLPFHTFYPHTDDVLDSCYCKEAHKENMKTFDKDKKVKEIIEDHITWFKEFAKKYKENIVFPEDVNLLESIQSAIHQFKLTKIEKEDKERVRNFTEKLYFYARAIDNKSVNYQTSEAFNFLRTFINETTIANANNVTREKNRKLAFLFIEDIMMVNIIKRLDIKFNKILPAASILTFNVTGTCVDDLKVKIRLNDLEDTKIIDYKEFLGKLNEFVITDKDSIKSYCNPTPA